MQAAQARLSEAFDALSAEALRANSEAFLQLARTQMQGGRAQAARDLQARQESIEHLLAPVRTTLGAMQDQVQALARERSDAEATLGTPD